MQGVVVAPENPQQGSPPPNNVIASNMEESLDSTTTKESSIVNDSGVFSATTNSTMDQTCDSDNRSDCSSPERKYFCPICNKTLTSQHNFTLHIRSHNNETEDDQGFTCKICMKVLSSSSSLDRHVLVHSGERPFTCKYCGDTFTTNGNMHRHMRTHSNKGESYESDGSTDSGGSSKSIEYNNNKVESKQGNKRRLENEEPEERQCKKVALDVIKCPVCERSDFNSKEGLEIHLEENHPEYPAKCNQCNRIFLNNKQLSVHKEREHNTSRSSVLGFDDLTFMDFSSEKFPHIARRECERNIHKPAGALKFQCPRCSKAFPCSSSLDIHEKSCLESPVGLNLSNGISEDVIRRAEFFSRLNLQDKSSDQDLADIPSIFTSVNIQFQPKSSEIRLPPSKSFSENTNDSSKHENEEESQDSFAIEFRKMKLRGEFPCRLCTAIFPNLRALKGHNRAHLSGNTNGTYYCNMCPHSSIDKAALIRHMRTHNGDRPYECSLCNYAFTTKANCERHLKNRHSKTTREEVKKSIIYHPSEDPTNDELNKLNLRDDSRRFSKSLEPRDTSPIKVHCSTPKMVKADVFPTPPPPPPLVPEMSAHKIFSNIDFIRKEKFLNGVSHFPFSPQPFNLSSKQPQVDNMAGKIQVKPFEALRDLSEDEAYEEDEEPPVMDVALDLSKKKMDEEKKRMEEEVKSEEEPQDLTKKSPTAPPSPDVSKILAQHFFKTPPKIDAAALYASQYMAHLYRSFPAWPGFSVNPLLLQAIPALHSPADTQEFKERMQRQLCGGTFKNLVSDDLKNFTQNDDNSLGFKQEPSTVKEVPRFPPQVILPSKLEEPELEPPRPLTINVDASLNKPDLIQSPNSVKMVIKNGVLMPKQKQRRYRTERPFTCEHCSARFTLRSNMERHIKQQHPQFWSQRQRGVVGQPGRKPQGLTMLRPSNYDLPKMHDYHDETKDHINEKLRLALLAQLRANNPQFRHEEIKKEEEDEEDCELIIDENDEKPKEEFSSEILRLRESRSEEDLVPVSRLLDNASQQQFKEYFKGEEHEVSGVASEEDEEGLVASGSTSEGNVSGTDENKSESEGLAPNSSTPVKKKSAYSLAPNRVSCPYCNRKFPWTSSLRRHILTHTGQKPFKCSHCPLLFTTKSNCDRHLLRKHGNSATTIVTSEASSNTTNYLMRNVPERPFKCSSCPSSTFSTYSNLKKHISCKHSTNAQGDDIKAQGYEAGSSEDEKANQSSGDWETQIGYSKFVDTHVPNSDLPFKCHLCESSFGERLQAVDHIRDKHSSEYDLLRSKNAFDANATTPDEAPHNDDEESDIRGKFPDYSNRKVICAWCMRRFWSAEDLRRHMRTHTGERPFSCDICRRRFTLKHSMLRHRKKHALSSFEQDASTHSDDEGGSGETAQEELLKPESDNLEGGSGGGDLISNLLGLGDRSIIDKALGASADDAAKLLGVKKGIKE